jgi:hypothetical protein
MEKFKQLFEEAQRLNESDQIFGNVKLIPTPNDVVKGIGNLLAKPFKKGVAQQSTQQSTNQLQQSTDQQQSPVQRKEKGTILYFRMYDSKLPNPLFIRYDRRTKHITFISENDFKKMV